MQENNVKQANATPGTAPNTQGQHQINPQDWKNFYFFTCTEKERKEALKLLKERNFLNANGTPNRETIEKQATFFADSLANRVSKHWRARRYGFGKIADNVAKYAGESDTSALYFYLTNIYGMVWWYAPYNLQRLPVHREAFKAYLDIFSGTFVARMNEIAANPPPRPPRARKKTVQTTQTKPMNKTADTEFFLFTPEDDEPLGEKSAETPPINENHKEDKGNGETKVENGDDDEEGFEYDSEG
jgi:hypothetical protein